jgi:hypothetical protein
MLAAECAVEYFRLLQPWMLDAINRRKLPALLHRGRKIGFTDGAGAADSHGRLILPFRGEL